MSSDPHAPNLPAVSRQELDGAVTAWKDPFSGEQPIYSTWPADLPDRRKLEVLAISEDAQPGANYLGKDLIIQHLCWHYVEIESAESGELVPAWRIILISPSGERVAFVSLSIFKAIKLLSHVHGEPPWDPPVLAGLGLKKTRQGRNWYTLTDRGRLGAVDAPEPSKKKRA
jgi:hypothetical protein